MEKGFEYWFHNQHTDLQLPNSNSLGATFDLRQQNTVPAYMKTCTNTVSPNGTLPVFAFSAEQPPTKASQSNDPLGWFYCLPRFRQAFAPALNSIPKDRVPAFLNESCEWARASNGSQKRFLVFDQSGDQTLMFSSGIGDPFQYLPSLSPKPHCAFELKKEELGIKRDPIPSPPHPLLLDEYNEENEKDDVRSEMHEDTEELNALLYSDDDNDYSEDEEETSTGHTPSTLTGYERQEWVEESREEVASSAGPAKRLKLLNGGYDVPSLVDTASSAKTNQECFDQEDDAESSCGDGTNQVFGESGSLSGIKRSRKENIRETISILQNLIPGGNKGKDPILVLDEAIHYLRSLKVKAKAIGLDSL